MGYFEKFSLRSGYSMIQIPIAETEHEDTQVWKGELSGKYSVCSAYKLLQDANLGSETKEFYRKLWSLKLSPKIAVTIWRISWDFIPNLANLRYRRVATNDRCPRCCSWTENSLHIFRDCPTTIEVWQFIHLAWIMNNRSQNLWEWLTWVFKGGTDDQSRLFCYALWLIWFSRNKFVHEREKTTGRILAQNIQGHMAEYEGVRAMTNTSTMRRNHKFQEDIPRVTIFFDAGFDSRNNRSATGLVVWDLRGELLVLKTIVHNSVSSPFAAEAYACLEGVKLGIALEVQSIKLMGDSRTVIKKCRPNLNDKSVIAAIIRDIQNKKSCFQEIIFQHIHRSRNSQAHRLAKEALESGENFYLTREELNSHHVVSERRRPRNPD
ncbi:uncharacterized protein LOC128283847 [Gossypium arboreum]|uniref:uncharacterized protein LOC128283847 n=1 Tax=Gossypium arboreum TaxID=29729 RepID=UPI0022F1BB6F|nr:uncharacterized protein LOC128283847 [Gossypium arboreum]